VIAVGVCVQASQKKLDLEEELRICHKMKDALSLMMGEWKEMCSGSESIGKRVTYLDDAWDHVRNERLYEPILGEMHVTHFDALMQHATINTKHLQDIIKPMSPQLHPIESPQIKSPVTPMISAPDAPTGINANTGSTQRTCLVCLSTAVHVHTPSFPHFSSIHH